ncbi:hypothetical protein U1Q18_022771, partial [Sarracenia purpurea var. burkii]
MFLTPWSLLLTSYALGYHAVLKMREYYSAWKVVERRLHRTINNLRKTCERVGALEIDVSKVKAEAERKAEAHGASKRETTEGLSTLMLTSEFNQILQQKIDLYMMSEEVKFEIAKYWDGGYNAFRKQAQDMFSSIDFSIIQPDADEEASYAEGDETAPGPAEGSLSGSNIPEQ